MLLLFAALLLAEEDLAPSEANAVAANHDERTPAAQEEPHERSGKLELDAPDRGGKLELDAPDRSGVVSLEQEPPPRVGEASLNAAAGLRGERRAGVLARAGDGALSFSLGVTRRAGPRAPERDELRAAVQHPRAHAELRLVPDAAGYLRLAAEAGVHGETLGLILDGRAARLGSSRFSSFGLRIEAEGDLGAGFRAGAAFSGAWLSLSAPPAAPPRPGRSAPEVDPWSRWGEETLDWAQRGELAGWASRELGPVSLTPALSFSLPARPGFEVRAALGAELELGAVKLRAELSCARDFAPALFLAELSLGATLQLR